MLKKEYLLASLVCFCISFPCFAFVFNNFNSLNGLSNDNSFQVIQDKDGFIWVATSYGLCKVGPNGIKKYYKNDGLPNNNILSLDIDKDGLLWIGTASGLCVFENGNIQTKYPGELIYRPVDLLVEPDFIYWLDQSGALFCMDRKSEKVTGLLVISSQSVISDGVARSISRSSDGSVLLAAYNGFYQVKRDKLEKMTIPGISDTTFFKVIEDAKHNIWLATYNKIFKIKDNQLLGVIEICSDCNSRINQLYVDKYEKIWYSGQADRPFSNMYYKGVTYNINAILNNKSVINDYICDNNGDIWMATFGGGLFFIKNKPYQYYNSNNGLATSYTTDIASINNKLYIGTNTSFHYFNKNDTLIRQFKLAKNKNATEYIRNISRFGKDFLVSFASQALAPYGYIKTKLGNGTDSLYFFNSRYVFGDTDRKVALVDHYDEYLTVYKNISGRFYSSYKFNKSLYLGKNAHVNRIKLINNKYFICTVKGLMSCELDFSNPQVHIFDRSVSDIILYRNMILVSGELGILMYSPVTDQIFHFKDFDNQYFLAIRFGLDGYDRLWISTENGIYLFDKDRINHLGPSDGLPSIHITNFEYQPEGNIMWLSSYDGIVAIYLDQLNNNEYKTPKFIIEEIVSGNKTYSYLFPQPSVLDKRDVQIKTAFFNYQSPNRFHLRYKIDNSKWYYTNGNTLNISNLIPGNHHIRMQASEYGYVWSDEVQYSFYVQPNWYERSWVRGLFLVGFLGILCLLIFFIIRANNKKTGKKIEFERKVIDLKLQALNAAINSHFVFNVLNAIQYFVSSNQQIKASRFIADFAKFMRIIIDNSNLTIVPIREEVRRTHLYIGLEMMRFEDRLTYTIHVDPTIQQDDIMLPNMIIQPFVENSILHGILSSKNPGAIAIEILDEGEWIRIRIKDNGIGIDAARQKKKIFNKKSIGLKNVLQRLELFSGKKGYTYSIIDLSTQGDKGTLVDILMPKFTLSNLS